MKLPWKQQGRGRTPKYTAETVRRLLREESRSTEADRVRRQVESLPSYLYDPKFRTCFRGLENYHARLPSVVSMYLRGMSVEEIAQYYRPVFTVYGITRSLDALCEYIAARLNSGK